MLHCDGDIQYYFLRAKNRAYWQRNPQKTFALLDVVTKPRASRVELINSLVDRHFISYEICESHFDFHKINPPSLIAKSSQGE